MERSPRHHTENQVIISPRTRRYTLQSIQEMPDATLQALETFAEGVDKRHHPIILEKGRGLLHTKRNGLFRDQPVPNHFPPERRRQDLLCSGQKDDWLHGEEQVCGHINPEGRHPRPLWVLGTQRGPQPADPGGQGEQRQLNSHLA